MNFLQDRLEQLKKKTELIGKRTMANHKNAKPTAR